MSTELYFVSSNLRHVHSDGRYGPGGLLVQVEQRLRFTEV